MSQNALAAFVAQNPSLALVPLKVDSSGSLITVSESGGDAVTIADGADVTQGAKADAAWASGAGSVVALLKALAAKSNTPVGTTVITATSGSVAASSAVATLAGTAGKTTYITGFTITGLGATAASSVLAAITGITTTLDYIVAVPAGATLGITPINVQFRDPIPATAANTAVVVTVPSFGTGNTAACVSATGFQL